jgi:hypothetical protein
MVGPLFFLHSVRTLRVSMPFLSVLRRWVSQSLSFPRVDASGGVFFVKCQISRPGSLAHLQHCRHHKLYITRTMFEVILPGRREKLETGVLLMILRGWRH